MKVYELMRLVDVDQVVSIGQLGEDGEQWQGTFHAWFTDGTPMSMLEVMNIYSCGKEISIEVW